MVSSQTAQKMYQIKQAKKQTDHDSEFKGIYHKDQSANKSIAAFASFSPQLKVNRP